MSGGLGAAGSCTNGGEMQLVFVLHYHQHHLRRHQLLPIVATFTDCNENQHAKTLLILEGLRATKTTGQ